MFRTFAVSYKRHLSVGPLRLLLFFNALSKISVKVGSYFIVIYVKSVDGYSFRFLYIRPQMVILRIAYLEGDVVRRFAICIPRNLLVVRALRKNLAAVR